MVHTEEMQTIITKSSCANNCIFLYKDKSFQILLKNLTTMLERILDYHIDNGSRTINQTNFYEMDDKVRSFLKIKQINRY